MGSEEIPKITEAVEEKGPEQPKPLGEIAKDQALKELQDAQKYYDQFNEKVESRNQELAELKTRLEEKSAVLSEQGMDAHSGLTAIEVKVIQQKINDIQREVGDFNNLLKEYEDTLENKKKAAEQYLK